MKNINLILRRRDDVTGEAKEELIGQLFANPISGIPDKSDVIEHAGRTYQVLNRWFTLKSNGCGTMYIDEVNVQLIEF